ncbi:hypothetical protein [Micromonospora radicis]|uniref:Uncharacterized protein n=1 Tax=Micromonospora radicis TaxID=1894971 RepID=A0A418MNW0_9ACTN|nr:hypothetical protein [Micromonospora radicis]RIV32735.1 hypothetical protein D2L64_24570 [Micromonospora radicis]
MIPDDKLPGLVAAVRGTVTNPTAGLDRFEGAHILILGSAGLDRAANRLTASGVGHGACTPVRRPIQTPDGTRMVPGRYLEIDSDDPDAPRGRLSEGRVGIAENPTIEAHQVLRPRLGVSAVPTPSMPTAPSTWSSAYCAYPTTTCPVSSDATRHTSVVPRTPTATRGPSTSMTPQSH